MNARVAGRILLPVHEWLNHRPSFSYLRRLRQGEFLPPPQVRRRQLKKLRRLVHAFLHNTGYGEAAGVDRDWLPRNLDDIRHLPIIDKDFLRTRRETLVNPSVPCRKATTGGSTGDPLVFYMDPSRQAADKAARMLTHAWWGIRPGEREAYIWASPIELNRTDRLKRVRDWLLNERLFSVFDLRPENIQRILKTLEGFRPRCFYAYSSCLMLLCQLARQAQLPLPPLPLQVIFCTAEMLYDNQRRFLSEAFGVPVANHYGSREGGFIAHECPAGGLHVIQENILLEVLDESDQPLGPGQDGQIVLTHLDNLAMPFIRYRTNDIGQWAQGPCPCGRGWSCLQGIKGRSNDLLLRPDGRWVHSSAMNYAVRDIPDLRQYQFIQEDLQTIRLLVVRDQPLGPEQENKIRAEVQRRMDWPVRVLVEYTDQIARSASGKHRYVISKVPRKQAGQTGVPAELGPPKE